MILTILFILLFTPEEQSHIDPTCYLDFARVSEAGCCFDGLDQDNDGLIDHQDPDCRGPQG